MNLKYEDQQNLITNEKFLIGSFKKDQIERNKPEKQFTKK
jgi:hypothetical protein